MVGTNQNYYMDHANERMDLILFLTREKKKIYSAPVKFVFYDQEFVH
jgi:hypothetical protein